MQQERLKIKTPFLKFFLPYLMGKRFWGVLGFFMLFLSFSTVQAQLVSAKAAYSYSLSKHAQATISSADGRLEERLEKLCKQWTYRSEYILSYQTSNGDYFSFTEKSSYLEDLDGKGLKFSSQRTGRSHDKELYKGKAIQYPQSQGARIDFTYESPLETQEKTFFPIELRQHLIQSFQGIEKGLDTFLYFDGSGPKGLYTVTALFKPVKDKSAKKASFSSFSNLRSRDIRLAFYQDEREPEMIVSGRFYENGYFESYRLDLRDHQLLVKLIEFTPLLKPLSCS